MNTDPPQDEFTNSRRNAPQTGSLSPISTQEHLTQPANLSETHEDFKSQDSPAIPTIFQHPAEPNRPEPVSLAQNLPSSPVFARDAVAEPPGSLQTSAGLYRATSQDPEAADSPVETQEALTQPGNSFTTSQDIVTQPARVAEQPTSWLSSSSPTHTSRFSRTNSPAPPNTKRTINRAPHWTKVIAEGKTFAQGLPLERTRKRAVRCITSPPPVPSTSKTGKQNTTRNADRHASCTHSTPAGQRASPPPKKRQTGKTNTEAGSQAATPRAQARKPIVVRLPHTPSPHRAPAPAPTGLTTAQLSNIWLPRQPITRDARSGRSRGKRVPHFWQQSHLPCK